MSSSSRRPSHSSLKPSIRRQPSLLSLTSKSRSTPPQPSVIFAQPEQGAKLASAIEKLPQPPPQPVPSSEEGGEEEAMPKREREGEPGGEEQTLAPSEPKRQKTESPPPTTMTAVTPIAVEPVPTTAATTEPTPMVIEPTPAVPSQPISVPEPAQPAVSSTLATPSTAKARSPSPSSRSWFSSLSRTMGTKSPEPEPAPAPSPDPPPLTDDSSSTTTIMPTEPNLIDITPSSPPSVPLNISQRKSTLSWFSSSSSSPPNRLSTSPSRSRHPLSQVPSTPVSIDDEVPRLPTVPSSPDGAPPAPELTAIDPSQSPAHLGSLNPATSRFTLSIPLLGRPKVPLEKAVAAAQAEDVRNVGQKTPVEEALAIAQVEDVREEDATIPDIIIAPALEKEPSKESIPDPPPSDKPTDAQSTWWDYVGWSGGSRPGSVSQLAAQSVPLPKSAPPSITSPPPNPSPALAGSPPGSPTPPGSSLPSSTSTPHPRSPPSVRSPLPGAGDPPSSARSAISAASAASQSSSWLVPWSWYPSSATLPSTAEEDEGEGEDGDSRTDAERVRDAALARDTEPPPPPSAAPAASALPPTTPPPPVNPVESTIASPAHKSGWTSFFAARAFAGKLITSEGEPRKEGESAAPGEMEVMDIPDDAVPEEKIKDAAKEPAPTSASAVAPSKEKEPKKKGPAQVPLTDSESVKKRSASPAPSKSSASAKGGAAATPKQPNLVLPTWGDTFEKAPRALKAPPAKGRVAKTLKFMSGVLSGLAGEEVQTVRPKGKGRVRAESLGTGGEDGEEMWGGKLPKAWSVVEEGNLVKSDVLRGAKKVVVFGIHGWFPGAVMRTMLGEPTGTSTKFVNMMNQALEDFQEKHGVKLEKITLIPLEGEGTISHRVEKLYTTLTSNEAWMSDLRAADVIFVATHSQGSIVSTHLLDRLIRDGHIRTPSPSLATAAAAASDATGAGVAGATEAAASKLVGKVVKGEEVQRVCCVALCGIHMGPLRYLNSSSMIKPYFQYFESAAALELFEFQNTDSEVSKSYVKALRKVVDHGTKMLYVASLDDQVVPVYSGLFTSVSHPLIMRALYIDGDAYTSSDFLSNLLVLLIRILNAGLSDSRLLLHLSEATAGSLSGIGHSTPYEEVATYTLAVNYLFLSDSGHTEHSQLEIEPFNAAHEQNDYEIPWSLRDLIADDRVAHFFTDEFAQLRDTFDEWRPKTAVLRDVKKKLQPIQRLSGFGARDKAKDGATVGTSKL